MRFQRCAQQNNTKLFPDRDKTTHSWALSGVCDITHFAYGPHFRAGAIRARRALVVSFMAAYKRSYRRHALAPHRRHRACQAARSGEQPSATWSGDDINIARSTTGRNDLLKHIYHQPPQAHVLDSRTGAFIVSLSLSRGSSWTAEQAAASGV